MGKRNGNILSKRFPHLWVCMRIADCPKPCQHTGGFGHFFKLEAATFEKIGHRCFGGTLDKRFGRGLRL